jgi:hypothetical protein
LRRLLANAERDIAKRTQRQTVLLQEIADAGNDHAALKRLTEDLARVQAATEVLETEWLVLTEELGE